MVVVRVARRPGLEPGRWRSRLPGGRERLGGLVPVVEHVEECVAGQRGRGIWRARGMELE